MAVVGALALVAGCSKKKEGESVPAAGTSAAKGTEITASGSNTTEKVGPETGGKQLGGEAVKLNKLEIGGSGFEGQYNEALDSWTYEKWEPQKDGTNDNVVRFYIDEWNDDWPKDVETFATKLGEKNFLDMGYTWPKIASKTPFEGGWVVTGESSDGTETETAFAVRIDKVNALCRGTVKKTAKDVAKTTQDAIDACKGATL
jgi:hypothetical protein